MILNSTDISAGYPHPFFTYLVKSHTVYGGNVHGATYACDLCGERVYSGEIHETDGFVWLCINCFKYIEALPESNIKESIKEFLAGNVI